MARVSIYITILNLLLLQHFGLLEGSRLSKFSAPDPPLLFNDDIDDAQIHWNKKIQVDYYAPTQPGPSQGMGHDKPPGVV